MKVERINVLINRNANKHRTYLYNEMIGLMNQYKFGGEFGNDYITLKSMPSFLTKILDKLKIKFERLK